MPKTSSQNDGRRLRVGSLFSGYGGLDLAVEQVFDARTVWFSEINEPVARVFAHHWPDAPNLGDITTIDWSSVEPVDVLCGGFPCQDVSTVGKMAGLKPGTRPGLWAHMATAIDRLQPEWVVIENVRGLLSATAIRPSSEGDDDERRNPDLATPEDATLLGMEPDSWGLGDEPSRPLRAHGAVLGDLADLRYNTRWIGLPASHVGAPHPRFRIFILARRALPNASGFRLGQGRGDIGAGQGATRHDRTQPSGVVAGLGFDNLTRHGLRHTGATWMADAGIALHVLQEILGHQSIETTKGYLHPDHRHLAEAARQANQFLSAAPTRRDTTRRDGPRL
ncbi:DNA cytosine methyltransferase [Dermacoccus nishinomiyaensis]|uniref:DNA cytosine methyltransferase n=1 Tax=Dermacoccus nishinomiyaensis TaxID=1274 RepID=UPI00248F0806|nr:DNA cytosine methyltransferase [Dermacoccus nishinomiyaensis]